MTQSLLTTTHRRARWKNNQKIPKTISIWRRFYFNTTMQILSKKRSTFYDPNILQIYASVISLNHENVLLLSKSQNQGDIVRNRKIIFLLRCCYYYQMFSNELSSPN